MVSQANDLAGVVALRRRLSERTADVDWWNGLPGLEWGVDQPPRRLADRTVAMAVALRARKPDLGHLAGGRLDLKVQDYADQLIERFLAADRDKATDDYDGYCRRLALVQAAAFLTVGMDARGLIDLARGMHEYMTRPPREGSLRAANY